MKTLIYKVLILLNVVFWPGGLRSQTITTTAGSVTSCPGEIAVPVNVTNFNGVGAISLALGFDITRLTYVGYQNLNSQLTVNGGLLIISANGDKVIISWANTVAANIGTGTLVQLRFNALTSTTNLNWDTQTPGNCEYASTAGVILPSTYTNGTATIHQAPVINTQPVNKTVLLGQNTSFSVDAAGTSLAWLWQVSTNGGGVWTDLTNNATYSGVTSPVLVITNALLTYNGYKYRCQLSGTCTPVIHTDVVTLTVVNPVTTTLPTASFCPGTMVAPVTVTNFTGVGSFSLVFSYDPAILTYTGYQAVNPALSVGTFIANASAGKVYMVWSSTSAVTIGSGTLVECLFTGVTGNSSLIWDLTTPGSCEYTPLSGIPLTSVFVNGNETIHGIPIVTTSPVNKTIAKGQGTTFSVTASGTGIGYNWQVSTNNGVLFTDLTNGGFYSGVSTSTLTVSSAQLTMSGYQYRCRIPGTCTPQVFSNAAILTVLPNVLVNCGTVTGCPGELIVPVTVTDFIGVGSFSLTLSYTSSVMTFTAIRNVNPALAGSSCVSNGVNGTTYLTWSSTTAATIAAGGTLLELVFTGSPGTSALNWDTQTIGNCEISDVNAQVIFSTWNNGSATIHSLPSITVQPVNKTIYGGGVTSFSVTGTGTSLAYLWQVSTNGGGSWSNVPNTAPYSGLGTSTLTINPASTSMNNYQYHCVVSGSCSPSVTSNAAVLTVTPNSIMTTPGGVTNSCTGNLSIPVSVTNCTNVGGITLTMLFDTTKMSFEGYHSLHAALTTGLLVVNRSGNAVLISWASTTAANIGSGTLLQLRFRANSGISTTLSWDTQTTGACEYSDVSGNIITSFYNGSNVSVMANALIVNAGPDVLMTGSTVQLNGTATGGTTPYAWSWSPTTGLSNPAIANPIASPSSTTTYLLTVTGGTCSGSDPVTVTVSIPATLVLQNISVAGGQSNCYNATQTITVAGSGTTFEVQAGASVTMIAGQKINYLPGTRVYSTGYLHGYITSNSQYCNTLAAPMVGTALEEPPVTSDDGSLFSVYPNPTPGGFTLAIPGVGLEKSRVLIYGTCGEKLLEREVESATSQFSLSGRASGIYFIRVIRDGQSVTKKLVVR